MASFKDRALKLVRSSPSRTFILFPVLMLSWELFLNKGKLHVQLPFLFVMLWGYLQYRLGSNYRKTRGGSGPGLRGAPQQLVTSGIYGWLRNPIYLGQIIFLVGLALTLRSLLAGLLAIVVAVWTHIRVLGDEKDLAKQFCQPYLDYMARVKRWVPGMF